MSKSKQEEDPGHHIWLPNQSPDHNCDDVLGPIHADIRTFTAKMNNYQSEDFLHWSLIPTRLLLKTARHTR